ncbi:MAG: hypothetical protein ACK4MQ_08280 [Hyphomonas sp.]
MVQTHASPQTSFVTAFRAGAALMAQLLVGLLLILVAGMVALITALAGVALAAAALAMRFAALRASSETATGRGDGVTLEARRTPRGWTVEQ